MTHQSKRNHGDAGTDEEKLPILYKVLAFYASIFVIIKTRSYLNARANAANEIIFKEKKDLVFQAVKDIKEILDDSSYDDGSYGPLFVRLAWHASGTYQSHMFGKSGGSNGATMRFEPESSDPGNKGLKIARDLLEPIKQKYELSYADIWTLAGVVAIREMGGPIVPWRPGREDFNDDKKVPKNGLLPDASLGAAHLKQVFGRMGLTIQDIVALCGAHVLGRCHRDRSGYSGPWTRSPTTFSNSFFKELIGNEWKPKKWDGPLQFEDSTGELMMLPSDIALLQDEEMKELVQDYAANEKLFFRDFASAFGKLIELGWKAPAWTRHILIE